MSSLGLGTKRLGTLFGLGLLVLLGIYIMGGGDSSRSGAPPGDARVPVGLLEEPEAPEDLATPSVEEPEAPVAQESRQALAAESPESVAAEATHGERDLLVRVRDAKGALLNGVSVMLYVQSPDGKWNGNPNALRYSGLGAEEIRNLENVHWKTELTGLAIWGAGVGLLRNGWQALDAGKTGELPALAVGIALPSDGSGQANRASRVPIDFSNWPLDGIDFRLSLEESKWFEPLNVEIYFADGRPASGIEIGLYGLPTNSNFGNGGFFDKAVSGADGVAHVPLLQVLRINALFSGMQVAGGKISDIFSFWAAPTIPLVKLHKVDMPEGSWGGKTMRMDLPPVAHLKLSFWDVEDKPYALNDTQMHYRVHWRVEADPSANKYFRTIREKTEATSVDLGWVGMGISASVAAWPGDQNVRSGNFQLHAIEAPGERNLKLKFEAPNVRLAWLLVNPEGQPLANETIMTCGRLRDLAADETREQKRHWVESKTDASGRLLRVMPADLRQPWLLECRWSGEEQLLSGWVELPMALPPRPRPKSPGDMPIVNMGEIAMSETPLPALRQPTIVTTPLLPVGEGVVVDETGAPIPGVWVRASSHGPGRSQNLGRVRTDSMGRFRLVAKNPVPFYLALDHPKYVYRHTQREEAYHAGTVGIKVVLQRGRQLSVSFVAMSLAFGGHVEVEAHGTNSKRSARQKGAAEFRFERLSEGTYEIVIQAERSRIELARFDKVEVHAEEAQPDPRLVEIDFTALAYARWYTFEGPDGKALDVDEISMQVPGYPGARESQSTNGTSRLFLVLPRDVPYVRFGVKGIGMAQVPMGDDDVIVRLQGGG